MNVKDKLNKVFLSGEKSVMPDDTYQKTFYTHIASNYAQLEGSIAVLSDLHLGDSSVFYGEFAQVLGIPTKEQTNKVNSIWEENLLRLVHSNDLSEKFLQELQFYNFILRKPLQFRKRYHLESELRMRDHFGRFIPVHHRMFYIYPKQSSVPRFALCLYNRLIANLPSKGIIINTSNDETIEIGSASTESILSAREKQILRMIAAGMTSKEIAAALNISINTVSRHRQDILAHLNVKNSLEACRTAKSANII